MAFEKHGFPEPLNLQYSFNPVEDNWNNIEGDTLYNIYNNNKISIRGKMSAFSKSKHDYWTIKFYVIEGFESWSNVSGDGNIMALIDYENPPTEIPNDYCFYKLFYENDYIVHNIERYQGLKLLAPTLKPHCYESMFENCKKLNDIIDTDTTYSQPYSFARMYAGCENISGGQAERFL